MSTPNRRADTPTLEQIHTHLLEIDPGLRARTRQPLKMPLERLALEQLEVTLAQANTVFLAQARAHYQGLASVDLGTDEGRRLLARLTTELNKNLQTLDETSMVDGQSRRTFVTFTAGIKALEQEARLNVADYLLTPADQRMLEDCSLGPPFRPGMYSLGFSYQDQAVTFAGAFVLTRQASPGVDSLSPDVAVGPVLLFTPSHGLEAFDSLLDLDQSLQAAMATQALAPLLPLRYQALDIAGIWPLTLQAIEDKPLFEHLYDAQLDKRRLDIDLALSLAKTGQSSAAQLSAQLDNAITAALPGLAARLAFRAQRLLEQDLHNSLPAWYRNANLSQREALVEQLHQYNQARQGFLDLFTPAATPQDFAHHQCVERLADELDIHDLDPHQLLIVTQRNVPGVGRYEHRQTLLELCLRGLHPGDELSDSDFLKRTTLTYAGSPLRTHHQALAPNNLVTLLAQLQPLLDFAAVQKQRLGDSHVKQAASRFFDRRLAVLASIAKLQGHLTESDYQRVEQLRKGPTRHLCAHVVLLHNAQLKDLWLLREDDANGQAQRLLLCTPEAPRAQQFIAFNSLRECQSHILGWVEDTTRRAGRTLRDYLLEQVPLRFRQKMDDFLQGVSLKPATEEHLEVTFGPACSHADCLDAIAAHRMAALQDDYEYSAPAWLRAASTADRRRLTSLGQDTVGALGLYNARPDAEARFPRFETYLHDKARLSLNTLLGRRQNDVDPDSVMVYAAKPLLGRPSEPLSYTRLYRDDYADGLGFLDEKFSASATFRGPAGVDLSPLTPQNVARSVTGVWIGQRYTDEVRQRLLTAASPGYGNRRDAVLAIQQLQMKTAALESRLQGHIASVDLAWLEPAIDSLEDNATRNTYRVHRLFIDGDWVIGNYLFSHAGHPTLLYTPNAPDGISFREARQFNYLLKKIDGMLGYWCARVPLQSQVRVRQFLDTARSGLPADINRTTPSPARHDAIEKVTPLTDLRHEFYNMKLQRQIDDVTATTVNRAQMISRTLWTCVEWVTAVATIPFPALSLALGGLLAFKDLMLAISAYHQGDHDSALQHYLGYLANIGGALVFDARALLAGAGRSAPTLHAPITRGTPSLVAPLDTLTLEGMRPVLFDGQALWARQNPDALGRYLLYRRDPLTGQVHSTARLVNQTADGQWVRAGVRGGGRKYERLAQEDNNPLAVYDITPDQSRTFRTLLDPEFSNTSFNWGDELAGAPQNHAHTQLAPLRTLYEARVKRLIQDADLFYPGFQAPGARTELPVFAPATAHADMLNTLFPLNKRLIIGAANDSQAGKQLLIENLPELAKQGLKRIYIENLPRDVFHHELNIINNLASGDKAVALQKIEQHLGRVDRSLGLAPDAPFGFRQLLVAAQRHGIVVDGLDGSVSYLMEHVLALGAGPRFIPRASKLRNFYAHTAIEHNLAGRPGEGWIALVEPDRLGSYEHVAGLSALQNSLALRIQNVPTGQPTGIFPDTASSSLSRGDYTLAIATPPAAPALPGAAGPSATTGYSAFDVPQAIKRDLEQMAGEHRGLDTRYAPAEKNQVIALNQFSVIRQQLYNTAENFFARHVPSPRPSLTSLADVSNEKAFIEKLYKERQGLVIGEAHSAQSSKAFLITHMKLLKKQGVKTLYMEHLLTDLHQEAVDSFQATLKIAEPLENYLSKLDKGQMPAYQGPNTYSNVVKVANKHGIRVRALDCTASYYIKGQSGREVRHKLFSYFANEVIKTDQLAQGPHKWVAFVGSSHTDVFVSVPGLTSLQDAVSLHLSDVAPQHAKPLHSGGWEVVQENHGVALRSDFNIEVGIAGRKAPPPQPQPARSQLTQAGHFLIEQPSAGEVNLVHRSRSDELVVTPIQIDQRGRFLIDRWPLLSDERFVYLSQLVQALKTPAPLGLGMSHIV